MNFLTFFFVFNRETQTTNFSTLWFVGLEFITNLESVDLNLTESIQNFTDLGKFFKKTNNEKFNNTKFL